MQRQKRNTFYYMNSLSMIIFIWYEKTLTELTLEFPKYIFEFTELTRSSKRDSKVGFQTHFGTSPLIWLFERSKVLIRDWYRRKEGSFVRLQATSLRVLMRGKEAYQDSSPLVPSITDYSSTNQNWWDSSRARENPNAAYQWTSLMQDLTH